LKKKAHRKTNTEEEEKKKKFRTKKKEGKGEWCHKVRQREIQVVRRRREDKPSTRPSRNARGRYTKKR